MNKVTGREIQRDRILKKMKTTDPIRRHPITMFKEHCMFRAVHVLCHELSSRPMDLQSLNQMA